MGQPLLLRDQMIRVGAKARLSPAPDCYLWAAVWWHLRSKESRNPSEMLTYARSQLRLARDMAARPDHYRRRPVDVTDWQWSGLAAAGTP